MLCEYFLLFLDFLRSEGGFSFGGAESESYFKPSHFTVEKNSGLQNANRQPQHTSIQIIKNHNLFTNPVSRLVQDLRTSRCMIITLLMMTRPAIEKLLS